MRIIKLALFAVPAAMMLTAAPASAFEVTIDEVMCPVEAFTEEQAMSLSQALTKLGDTPPDVDLQPMTDAINACGAKFNWSADDRQSVLRFNLAALAAAGLEEKLLKSGVSAVEYESILEGQGPDQLQALIDGKDGRHIADLAVERLTEQQGDKVTDEIAGDLSAYLGFVARMQLLAFKMMGIES